MSRLEFEEEGHDDGEEVEDLSVVLTVSDLQTDHL